MKITILTPFTREKDSRAQRLAEELRSLGNNVDIISVEAKDLHPSTGRFKKRISRYLSAAKAISGITGGIIAVNCEITILSWMLRLFKINKNIDFLVIDVYDHHGYIFKGISAKIFASLERLALTIADAAIIPIPERINQYSPKLSNKILKKVFFISNIGFKNPTSTRMKADAPSNIVDIVYAGTIDEGRGLHSIIETAKLYPDEIKVRIYGNGPLLPELMKLNDFNKIYQGGFNFQDLQKIYSEADLICAFYELVVPNHQFCDPNKLREIFEFNKPVLTNSGTPLSKIVESMGIGFTIENVTATNIINAARATSKSRRDLSNAIESNRDSMRKLIETNKDSVEKLLTKLN